MIIEVTRYRRRYFILPSLSKTCKNKDCPDWSVNFDKRSAYKQPYIRIMLKMESKKLIKQIQEYLVLQNIKSHLVDNNRVIQINGKKSVLDFYNKIGFSNPRHKNKILALFNDF